MPRHQPTLRVTAALIAVVALAPRPVLADPLAAVETRYATLLRTINPHLQEHQSLAFARSILATAERNGLDPKLLTALVTVESGWRPDAVSWAGARGLGQLMPATARKLGVNPFDPAQNLHGAARYLRSMLDRFANRGRDTLRYALGAYNAGPKAIERYHGIPPFGETQNYVRKVLNVQRTLDRRIDLAGHPSAPDERAWLANADSSALALDAATAPAPAPAVAGPAVAPPTPKIKVR
jgi:soluble lytic murein transglycosylase-like protein